jgi:hypothetical protein
MQADGWVAAWPQPFGARAPCTRTLVARGDESLSTMAPPCGGEGIVQRGCGVLFQRSGVALQRSDAGAQFSGADRKRKRFEDLGAPRAAWMDGRTHNLLSSKARPEIIGWMDMKATTANGINANCMPRRGKRICPSQNVRRGQRSTKALPKALPDNRQKFQRV